MAAKLQVEPGQRVALLRVPEGVVLDLPDGCTTAEPDAADAVVVFVADRAELDVHAGPAVAAAHRDALAWVAYPKAGKLGTDLDRDRLAEAMIARGAQPVRQVAVDDVWSALRFRPV